MRNYLKHNRKTKIEDLIVRLHIEEDNVRNPYVAKANVIEHCQYFGYKKRQFEKHSGTSLTKGSSWDL